MALISLFYEGILLLNKGRSEGVINEGQKKKFERQRR